MGRAGRVDVALVVGGQWHDLDFARLQLLTELFRHDVARTRVFESYPDPEVIASTEALITYTCNVRPDPRQQDALVSSAENGLRWLALHGTHSAIDPPAPDGPRIYRTPRAMGAVAPLLGSQFLAHPPIEPYLVEVISTDDPLVAGIEDFVARDELYICELHPPFSVLMQSRYRGPCRGFEEGQVDDDKPRPVMYRKRTGAGEVCYLTLGHCRGRFDMQSEGVDDTGTVDRGSWDVPEYSEVLARLIAWAVHGNSWTDCTVRSNPLTSATLGSLREAGPSPTDV
jgi:type 1 glutamine amidotransferase